MQLDQAIYGQELFQILLRLETLDWGRPRYPLEPLKPPQQPLQEILSWQNGTNMNFHEKLSILSGRIRLQFFLLIFYHDI